MVKISMNPIHNICKESCDAGAVQLMLYYFIVHNTCYNDPPRATDGDTSAHRDVIGNYSDTDAIPSCIGTNIKRQNGQHGWKRHRSGVKSNGRRGVNRPVFGGFIGSAQSTDGFKGCKCQETNASYIWLMGRWGFLCLSTS